MDGKQSFTYNPPYTTIYVERGTFSLGHNETPCKWERNPQGTCVTLAPMDENDKQCGEAQICGYRANPEFIVIRLMEMLGIRMDREFVETLIRIAIDEGVGRPSMACVFCDAWGCGDCPNNRREIGAKED